MDEITKRLYDDVTEDAEADYPKRYYCPCCHKTMYITVKNGDSRTCPKCGCIVL